MQMKSMKREEKKEKSHADTLFCGPGGHDEYSYGLRINLGEEEIAKLGLKELPKAGEEMTVSAKVKVCSVNQNDTTEGVQRRVELQITELGIE